MVLAWFLLLFLGKKISESSGGKFTVSPLEDTEHAISKEKSATSLEKNFVKIDSSSVTAPSKKSKFCSYR